MASWTESRRQREHALAVRFLARKSHGAWAVPGHVVRASRNPCETDTYRFVIDEQRLMIVVTDYAKGCTRN